MNLKKRSTQIAFGLGILLLLISLLTNNLYIRLIGFVMLFWGHTSSLISTYSEIKSRKLEKDDKKDSESNS